MTTPIQYDKEQKTFTITQSTGITFSLALLLMLASAVVSATTWVTTTQGRIDNLALSVKENRENITNLTKKANDSDVKFVEIQTQLKSIDANLLEIKDKLKG